MWKEIKPVVVQILTSKKAYALIAGVVIWALAQAGIAASPEQVLPVLALLGMYIGGQGLSDIGKEAKKVEVQGVKDFRAQDDSSEKK